MDKTLSLRVLFAGVDKLTAPLRQIGQASAATGRELATTKREVRQLEQATSKLRGFRDLQRQLAGTHAEMDQTARRVRTLRAQIDQTDKPTRELARELKDAETHLRKLGTAAGQQSGKLASFRSDLDKAGVDVRNLASEEDRLGRSIDGVNRKLAEQSDRHERAMAASRRTERLSAAGENLRGKGATGLAVGAAVAVPLAIGAKSAMAFEDAMADVRKVVNATDAEFGQLTRNIKDLSRTTPMPPAAIASIVAAGARAGVARQDLAAFAYDAIKMGIAFDSTADEAGATMATWRTAFKLTQPEVVALADRVNALTNAYGGNVGAVTEMVTRIGPLGEVAGVAAPSLAAIAQLMNSVGVQSEIGATGIKNMMLALSKGTSATKRQQAAFTSLGLEAEAVSKRMQVDSKGTILDVLTRISKLDASTQAGVLDQMFGSESIAAIAPLLTNLGALERNFAMVGDEAQWAGSMTAEYAARASTSSAKIDRMKNRLEVMKITLGEKLLPVLITGAEWLGRIADAVSAFADRNPRLTAALVTMLAILATVAIVGGGLLLILGGLASVFAVISAGAAVLGVGLLPLLGIAAAVVAVVGGAALLIYSNWERLSSGFSAFMQPIADWLGPRIGGVMAKAGEMFANFGALMSALWNGPVGSIIQAVLGTIGSQIMIVVRLVGQLGAIFMSSLGGTVLAVLGTLVGVAGAAFDFIGNGIKLVASVLTGDFSGAWEAVKGMFKAGGDAITAILSGLVSIFTTIGTSIMNGLGAGLRAGWDLIKAQVGGIASMLPKLVTGGGPKRTAAPAPQPIAGKRAKGGPVSVGKRYLVGEEGPEIFEPPASGRIISNDNLVRKAGKLTAASLALAPLAAAAMPSALPDRETRATQAPLRVSNLSLRSDAGSKGEAAESRTAAAKHAPAGDTINIGPIYQQPGENAEQLARRVSELISQQKADRRRGAYRDGE